MKILFHGLLTTQGREKLGLAHITDDRHQRCGKIIFDWRCKVYLEEEKNQSYSGICQPAPWINQAILNSRKV